jgi:hypothetical protein
MIPDPFKYVQPTDDMLPHFDRVAVVIAAAYRTLLEECPRSAERTLAIRDLQRARMWANAAISFKGEAIET